MRHRLCNFGLVIATLSVATAVRALPPPSDLKTREKRNAAPRAIRVTPTPTPPSAPAESPREAASAPAPARQSITVVVDAGHGGFDRGGIPGQRVAESVMTLDVAQRVRRLLEAAGYRVVMTRNTDVFVPLGTRVAIGNSYRNAIFVCIHFNSATRRGANGIETYFFSQQSLPLASAIHYYVNGVAPTPNRGVRRRGFFVLRRSSIPAVLVECGFLTNPTEAQYAQNAAYRDKLAGAIVRGIQSRGSVGSAAVASGEPAVPLQPFIDQTRTRNADVGRSHRAGKRSKKAKKSSSSSSGKKKKSSASQSGD